ncbi:general stress protein [Acidihalobacter yilgarnensis]|uniref:General stress protein n=1 Tax=Acidihalobacter yilgarnensis TaxID=2819280 RepID=A0A1D8INY9_9GAMM|nr:aldo/keto reductase [Acidihalobacter yilgarnensis]AOU98115.1 general stress protein [Acidihalobacter yilgarnensis]
MEYTRLTQTDMEIPKIGLGTWAIGGWMWGGTDEQAAIDTIHAALDRGITLIDTAPVYGFGNSEEIVGKALAQYGRREHVTLATKVGLAWQDGRVTRDSSPSRIRQEIEDSLRRLGTDYIDIYQVHWPDGSVPFEETAATLEALRIEGKIRAIGVSNYSPAQMAAFAQAAPLATNQPPYNLFEREIEGDVADYCIEHGVGMIAYGALCRGLLSGRMQADTQFTGDDLRLSDPKFQAPRYVHYLEAVRQLDEYAQTHHGRRVIHLALRWLIDQPGVATALWGARRPDQLEPVEAVMGWSLSDEDRAAIDGILQTCIPDPVGPEFMAPPENAPLA